MLTVAAQSDTVTKEISASTDETDYEFVKVEKESGFPGGEPAWQKFADQHLVYPAKAVRKKIEGTVTLQFIVTKDGTITEIEAISGPEILRKAAIEVLKKSPKWIPLEQGGRPVKAFKKLPIVFRLTK